ncbi:hypothetical protein F4860DRAFT_478296 [Xylaria cubensis]|nr:hypothetical protein F4860DRAFT_478296 [Xylaria cubensis]
MATISEAQINDLAARTTIHSGGNSVSVIIPGAVNLSQAERTEIYKRALELQAPAPLDIDTLFSKLRDITPPLDEDAWDAEIRSLDAEARQDLINDGCPPCYPPNIEVPVRNPPPEYKSIVSYWQPSKSMVEAVLCAQRSDWREFRRHQTRERARYGERKFHRYVERATEMRRRHGMAGDVRFLFKKELQSQLETWTEYQFYHLIDHEKLERERDDFISRQKGITPGTNSPPEWALALMLKDRIGMVEHHNILLEWTEQQRLAMKAAPGLPAARNTVIAPRALRKTSRASRAVLGMAGVSKTAPTKRGARVRRPAPPVLADTNTVTTRSGRVSRPPVRWASG